MAPSIKKQTVSIGENPCSRLVLGTAQLGLDYGIANKTGSPDSETAKTILKLALNAGICEFDTAQGYGSSEKILGEALSSLNATDQVRIITKPSADIDLFLAGSLKDALTISLDRLGIKRAYGFMLHKERLLDQWQNGLGKCMKGLAEAGLVEHIGISVYTPKKAFQALSIDEITIVQIPSNVLDRRFEEAGVFREAARRRKQLYVRSVFLQGLLLVEPEGLSPRMAFAAPTLDALRSLADSAGITCHRLALGYVRDAYPDAKIIFGAETPEQVARNVEAWRKPLLNGLVEQIQERFRDVEVKVLNPVLWQ
ncbi:aldo/keto reductase [Candidatus Parcubacteria bacterium]|nr:MAG: aldo/keto reductase [Candidatus Parcubacteria bacterium]